MLNIKSIKKIAPMSRNYQETLGAISITLGFIGLFSEHYTINNNLPNIEKELINSCQKAAETFGKLDQKGQRLIENKIKSLGNVWQYHSFSLITYYALLIPCLVDIETKLKHVDLKEKHDCIKNIRTVLEKLLIYHENRSELNDEEVEYGYHLYVYWTNLF